MYNIQRFNDICIYIHIHVYEYKQLAYGLLPFVMCVALCKLPDAYCLLAALSVVAPTSAGKSACAEYVIIIICKSVHVICFIYYIL